MEQLSEEKTPDGLPRYISFYDLKGFRFDLNCFGGLLLSFQVHLSWLKTKAFLCNMLNWFGFLSFVFFVSSLRGCMR